MDAPRLTQYLLRHRSVKITDGSTLNLYSVVDLPGLPLGWYVSADDVFEILAKLKADRETDLTEALRNAQQSQHIAELDARAMRESIEIQQQENEKVLKQVAGSIEALDRVARRLRDGLCADCGEEYDNEKGGW